MSESGLSSAGVVVCCGLAPLGHVGEVSEVLLFLRLQRAPVLGRGEDGLLRRELLVKVTHVLQVALEARQTTFRIVQDDILQNTRNVSSELFFTTCQVLEQFK